MRIGLITTLNTNIGDDFIREGICMVLRRVFQGHEIEFVPVNKHQPLTVYPVWHPIHLAQITRYLPKGRTRISDALKRCASELGLSRFGTCELIVQCGAPVLWPGCHGCEWAEPLWHHVIGRLYRHVPVLNLAAGSCYPWERQPTAITDPRDAEYLRTVLGYCRLTTVRDALAHRLSASLGVRAPLIPCSAFLAAGDHAGAVQNADGGVIVLNYMSGGGHYEWNQGIDRTAWHETVKALAGRLRKRHRLAFLCHNKTEEDLARGVDATLPRLWPKTPQEYFSLVAEAKVGLCNRMHAAVALAGMGIPSIAVGADTRLLMVDTLGLPCVYVKEARADQLEEGIENLLARRREHRDRLLALRSETWSDYITVVAGAIQQGTIG